VRSGLRFTPSVGAPMFRSVTSLSLLPFVMHRQLCLSPFDRSYLPHVPLLQVGASER
jgi:hypothetical protein